MSDASALLERFATGQYKPATFLERGVSLPFTTPQLLGGRIRPGGRQGAELVLANPAGTDGVYILPWAAMPDICSPSLHDRALWTRVAQSPLLTPRTVRAAAQAVAAEGYAGRAAARAAEAAVAESQEMRTLVHYQLLLELVRQGEADNPSLADAVPPERDSPANVQRRSHAVLRRLKAGGAVSPATAVQAIEELAEVFAGCGVRRDPTRARLPRLLQEIADVGGEIAHWAETTASAERTPARLMVQAAELTLRCARIALDMAHGLTDNMWSLLHRWRLAPEEVLSVLARPEWALDGWEVICSLWREADTPGKAGALFEMAVLVPVIPSEVRDWCGFDASAEMEGHGGALRRWRRAVQPNQDWMSGRLVDIGERNERLRTIAA